MQLPTPAGLTTKQSRLPRALSGWFFFCPWLFARTEMLPPPSLLFHCCSLSFPWTLLRRWFLFVCLWSCLLLVWKQNRVFSTCLTQPASHSWNPQAQVWLRMSPPSDEGLFGGLALWWKRGHSLKPVFYLWSRASKSEAGQEVQLLRKEMEEEREMQSAPWLEISMTKLGL